MSHIVMDISDKKSWPNLVGDTVERATAIIRWCTRYQVWVRKHGEAPPSDSLPYRVVLYLDKDGFVSRTPRVG
jgi:hypothetical protein